MHAQNPLTHLVNQLSKFPGVGEKSAQRLAFFLLSIPKSDVSKMAEAMTDTRNKIRYCETCFNISFTNQCHVCASHNRDRATLCVVAAPKDLFAFEKAGDFKGVYHVLGGLISPIDGMHPEMLRLEELISRVRQGDIKEVILAINSTVEGDATTLYLSEILGSLPIKITKLAYGLPVGADIDYADELTLQRALSGRKEVS